MSSPPGLTRALTTAHRDAPSTAAEKAARWRGRLEVLQSTEGTPEAQITAAQYWIQWWEAKAQAAQAAADTESDTEAGGGPSAADAPSADGLSATLAAPLEFAPFAHARLAFMHKVDRRKHLALARLYSMLERLAEHGNRETALHPPIPKEESDQVLEGAGKEAREEYTRLRVCTAPALRLALKKHFDECGACSEGRQKGVRAALQLMRSKCPSCRLDKELCEPKPKRARVRHT
jgi:hypothetical protein